MEGLQELTNTLSDGIIPDPLCPSPSLHGATASRNSNRKLQENECAYMNILHGRHVGFFFGGGGGGGIAVGICSQSQKF